MLFADRIGVLVERQAVLLKRPYMQGSEIKSDMLGPACFGINTVLDVKLLVPLFRTSMPIV